MTTAVIAGIAGQDGAYLARHLIAAGYRVVGALPDGPVDAGFVEAYLPGVVLQVADVTDRAAMRALLDRERPDEVYNLASISSVARSWAMPLRVTQINGLAVLGLLEDLRELRDRTGHEPRLCQASSAEIFGTPVRLPQRENDPLAPANPYAIAKALAHESVRSYRTAYGMHVSSMILFNHESPLRPATFVTRKITTAAVEIAAGLRDRLELGRLDIRRDWGFAGDYVRAMHLAVQATEPGDFVVATGQAWSLEEFVGMALTAAGVDRRDGLVRSVAAFVRPTDVPEMRGDPAHTESVLGWRSELPLPELVERMVLADRQRLTSGQEHHAGFLTEDPAVD